MCAKMRHRFFDSTPEFSILRRTTWPWWRWSDFVWTVFWNTILYRLSIERTYLNKLLALIKPLFVLPNRPPLRHHFSIQIEHFSTFCLREIHRFLQKFQRFQSGLFEKFLGEKWHVDLCVFEWWNRNFRQIERNCETGGGGEIWAAAVGACLEHRNGSALYWEIFSKIMGILLKMCSTVLVITTPPHSVVWKCALLRN